MSGRGNRDDCHVVEAYSDEALQAVVEDALTCTFAGVTDDCSYDELFERVYGDSRARAAGDAAVMRALDAMEAANKVLHRESRIHLI